MENTFCPMTGLLFINGVAFTREKIDLVLQTLANSLQCQGQFNYSITIEDTANEATITINKDNVKEFMAIISTRIDVASDKDF